MIPVYLDAAKPWTRLTGRFHQLVSWQAAEKLKTHLIWGSRL